MTNPPTQHHFNHLLITGGCGFIGTNFIRHLINHTDIPHITNLDALTYAGNRQNLVDLESNPRYTFVHGNINDRPLVNKLIASADAIVHMAAESHVDRSIIDASPFTQTNILGTQTLLDALRETDPKNNKRFLYISTDEVYGHLPLNQPELKFSESSPLLPRSPYAATKAAADLLVQAHHHTYKANTLITRCSNNFGPYQYPEKIIPLFVHNALQNKPLPLYGDGLNIRDWIYVDNHITALLAVLQYAPSGEIYNIGSNCEIANIDLTQQILYILNKPNTLIEYVEDRPGHDLRYAVDVTKIKQQLGWHPHESTFNKDLEFTVNWYLKI
ncbi:dTDP-glucose 4,6-dehydratase [Poriferisphaera corsica]|uniref:dTDP-glucose 4,6-dehydratase n=1 Tax=Poriferisphaera corsica TaxID=2528020 RepID=A0A517YY16_9BACT|nr:dTDP-glucose 4,6-dehydratase [Poriferisphaera corsica]QDU35105.1 dTDP-glucose 4,6-dehydratase [Poriferisphaera corsica]